MGRDDALAGTDKIERRQQGWVAGEVRVWSGEGRAA